MSSTVDCRKAFRASLTIYDYAVKDVKDQYYKQYILTENVANVAMRQLRGMCLHDTPFPVPYMFPPLPTATSPSLLPTSPPFSHSPSPPILRLRPPPSAPLLPSTFRPLPPPAPRPSPSYHPPTFPPHT